MINHFIYTHPVELFSVQVLLMLYFSLLFHFPFLFWQIIDFFKSSLTAFEYSRIYILIIIVFSFLFMINTITCFYLFPSIWLFFVNFNHMSKFFLELRIQEYFFFVKDFIYLLNESILFSIFLFTFFVFNGFHVLLRWKKLFIFLIMMFSTFLSPPEICSQLLLFFFFMFFFELIVLVYIIIVKFYKYIIISKVIY
jgi:Sec-independent protein secretion pathway component TatC